MTGSTPQSEAERIAELVADVRADIRAERIAELEAVIARARAVHVRCPSVSLPWCLADGRLWPCPTIRALGGPDA